MKMQEDRIESFCDPEELGRISIPRLNNFAFVSSYIMLGFVINQYDRDDVNLTDF